MSNYPDDMRGSSSRVIEMRCIDCGTRWTAAGTWDCGSTEFDDPDDEQCPDCGSWNTEDN